MASIVTGSVAERVAPTIMASMKSMLTLSSLNLVQRNNMTPRTTADINVPAKANVNMEPMLRKKLVYDGQRSLLWDGILT
jgi:hypothetical protein